MGFLQNKLVLLILGGVVIAGVVWYSFLRDRSVQPTLESSNLTEATEADSDIVSTLLELRAVSLSGTIFSDPAFLQLQDFGQGIVPEPVGRPNPFAPLPGMGAAAASARLATSSPATSSPATSTRQR